jgi:hypothetical protein
LQKLSGLTKLQLARLNKKLEKEATQARDLRTAAFKVSIEIEPFPHLPITRSRLTRANLKGTTFRIPIRILYLRPLT